MTTGTDADRKNKILMLLGAVFVCALWGSLYPCVKIGYDAFGIQSNDIPSIILFAGLRFVMCGLVLVIYVSARDKGVHLPGKTTISPLFIIGFLTIVLHYSFTYIALAIGESSKSALFKQIGYLFISGFAFLFRKEDKFSVRKLIGGLVGFFAIVVINLDGSGFTFQVGDLLIVLASVCSVTGNVISKNAFDRIEPVYTVAYSQLMGGSLLALLGLLLGGRLSFGSYRSVLVIAYICAASVTAYSLWNIILKHSDLSKLAIIKFAEPLFGVVFSGLLLGEDILKPTYGIGIIIVSIGIMVGTVERQRRICVEERSL